MALLPEANQRVFIVGILPIDDDPDTLPDAFNIKDAIRSYLDDSIDDISVQQLEQGVRIDTRNMPIVEAC